MQVTYDVNVENKISVHRGLSPPDQTGGQTYYTMHHMHSLKDSSHVINNNKHIECYSQSRYD